MANYNPKLELTKGKYSDASVRSLPDYTDIMEAVPKLSNEVMHLAFGSKDYSKKNFPMLFLTKGQGNVKVLDEGHFDYRMAIMGKPKKGSAISRTVFSATDTPGIGRSTFTVPFKDGFFAPQKIVTKSYAGEYYNLRVQDIQKSGTETLYTFTYEETDPTKFVPVAILQADTFWVEGIGKVSFMDSDGTLSRTQTYGEVTNSLGVYRYGLKAVGNTEGIAMVYSIPVDGQVIRFAQDWELFQMQLQFNEQLEFDCWTSKYGKNLQGEIVFNDIKTGMPITSGAGIDQQIINGDTYSTLTFQKWNNLIRHIFFNVRDFDGVPVIDVYTGTIGMERVNEMLMNKASGFSAIANNAIGSQLVQGSGYDMTFGAFFSAFNHIDGYRVNFIKHPMFDRGLVGESSDIDTATGLPESSGDFYFVDRSTYGGKNNLTFVESATVPMTLNTVTGVGKFSKRFGGDTTNRAHARNSAEIHGMGSGGVHIMNPSTCFKLKYVKI